MLNGGGDAITHIKKKQRGNSILEKNLRERSKGGGDPLERGVSNRKIGYKGGMKTNKGGE